MKYLALLIFLLFSSLAFSFNSVPANDPGDGRQITFLDIQEQDLISEFSVENQAINSIDNLFVDFYALPESFELSLSVLHFVTNRNDYRFRRKVRIAEITAQNTFWPSTLMRA